MKSKMLLKIKYYKKQKRNKRINKLVKELMLFDYENNRLSIPNIVVEIEKPKGFFTGKELSPNELIDYMLLPIIELTNIIPEDKTNQVGELANKSFYKYMNIFKPIYKSKAEECIKRKRECFNLFVSVATLIISIISLLINCLF